MQTESENQTTATSEAQALEPTAVAKMAADETLRQFAGVLTPAHFAGVSEELTALTEGCGVYDLGWRTRLRITGADRVRWLNGMVTNTVKDLNTGELNYTFLLNAQGRIQGDGEVYTLNDALLFVTDRERAPGIAAHLDRFIIMDDVALAAEDAATALGVAGPDAEALLVELGLVPQGTAANRFEARGNVLTARDDSGQFTVWTQPAEAAALWKKLTAAGAVPCGVDAVESLRVLRGRPRYGADIHEKSLAQETGQMRALNFNKGCYLGQEIVERIRSRATVHRRLYCFVLEGEAPAVGAEIFAGDAGDAPEIAVGAFTSITAVDGLQSPELRGIFALGTARAAAVGAPLRYAGGVARALDKPPLPLRVA